MVFRTGLPGVLVAAWLLVFPAVGLAQTVGATTGAVDGTVTDRTGAVLPGVTVTAASDAVMGPRTTVTAPDGTYRLPALPPGIYGLSFALAGFDTVTRRDIRVSLGGTASVDVVLDIRHGEAVTVRGAAAVDRRTTTIATVFDAADLAQLPGPRTPGAIMAAAPAVQFTRFDVGGSNAFSVGPFSVYGTGGYNRPTLEGISISNMHPLGFALDYGTFASVAVGAGAYGPEWPTPGLHLQFITKSGGNRYAGTVHVDYEHGSWQAHNIDARQIAAGAPAAARVPARAANRLREYRDLNADVGGYMRKDRLWWYVSSREHASSARQVNFPVEPLDTRLTTFTAKGTWRVTGNQQVVVFAHGSHNRQPIKLDGFLRAGAALNDSVESTSSLRADGLVWKADWSSSVGTRLFVEARAGQFVAGRTERPNGSSPRIEDRASLDVYGGNRDWDDNWRHSQLDAALSYFHDGRFGWHQLKAGLALERRLSTETWTEGFPGDVLHVTQNGLPREVYLFQTPSTSQSGQWWYALHASDAWQVTDRLTLNSGVRLDRLRAFLPAQHHPAGRFNPVPQSFPAVDSIAAWNVIAPRIGASYDVFGGGRTILKGSYGLYWLPTGVDLGFNVNPNPRVWWERFRWIDVNGDGRWQPGEQSGEPERRGGEAIEGIDPQLKLGYVNEATARVEREAAPGLFIGTGVVWRGERRLGARQRESWPFEAFSVPLLLRDPGPDGTPGTADDGADVQVFQLPPDLVSQSRIVVRNGPHSASDFLTWEVVARRRLSGGWSLAGSFAHTWNRDQAREFLGQAIRANEFPATPNDFINTDPEGRHVYRSWSGHLLGTWEGPWRIRLTPLVRHQSGQAFGRTLNAGLNFAAVPVLAEPVGSRRQRHVTLVDVRLEKDVWRAGSRSLTPFLDVFNLLNANPEQNVSWETASFLRPLVIVPPRIARVGFRLDW